MVPIEEDDKQDLTNFNANKFNNTLKSKKSFKTLLIFVQYKYIIIETHWANTFAHFKVLPHTYRIQCATLFCIHGKWLCIAK